jgi:hypothetical protein
LFVFVFFLIYRYLFLSFPLIRYIFFLSLSLSLSFSLYLKTFALLLARCRDTRSSLCLGVRDIPALLRAWV